MHHCAALLLYLRQNIWLEKLLPCHIDLKTDYLDIKQTCMLVKLYHIPVSQITFYYWKIGAINLKKKFGNIILHIMNHE